MAVVPVGKVILRGVYDDRVRLREITDAMLQEIPGIQAVEDSVLTTEAIFPFLTETLAQRKLAHKLRFETENGRLFGLLVTGKISKAELESWRIVKLLMRSTYGLDITDRWTDKLSPAMLKSANTSRELDNDLMAVGVGPLNFLTMRTGRRYFEGTKLSGGHIIKSIQKDRIVLELDGVEDVYYLEGGIK